jgi:hypothetical protein
MRVSAIMCGRNDNYGGRLNERATYCFNTMLDTFDEVIYVDWNTDGERILTDELDICVNPDRLKIITVTPQMCSDIMGAEDYKRSEKCCHVLAKNIGIRRATGDVIVSTNIDIIPPKREYLDVFLKELKPDELVTFAKHDVEVDQLHKIFEQTKSYTDLRDILPLQYGVNPISARLIIPCLSMDKRMISTLPLSAHHTASSIICACGDFQVAHKDLWFKIRGFEESMIKRLYVDSIVQYKAILEGATVRATNFPPVYHLEHARNNAPDLLNQEIPPGLGSNPDTWGFSAVNLPLVLYKSGP